MKISFLVMVFFVAGCGFIRTDSITYEDGLVTQYESTTAWTLGKTILVNSEPNQFEYLSEPQDAEVYTPYGVGKLRK